MKQEYIEQLREDADFIEGTPHDNETRAQTQRRIADELEAMDVVWVPRGPDPLGEALNSGDGTYKP